MKSIGIITLNGYFNYGNRLQNYALQTALEKLKFKVDTIWWNDSDRLTADKEIVTFQNFRRYILNRHKFREVGKRDFVANVIKEYNIKKFNDKYIHTIFDYQIKSDLNDRYDYFIVGSDQVWNPHYKTEIDTMYLMFADKQKRIAYAASYGVSELPKKYEGKIKNALEGMHAISTREEMGAKIVKNLTSIDVPVLIDPVALLTQEEWCLIAEKPSYIKDQRYILMYFLEKTPEKIQNEVKKLAKEKGLTIIDLMDRNNLDHYCTSPQEFIWLIKNCEIMYTDSFHGTIFSIIMNRPFIVTTREIKRKHKGADSRIDTILKLFNLSDRKALNLDDLNKKNIFDISFSNTETIMEGERSRSIEYLKKALDIR